MLEEELVKVHLDFGVRSSQTRLHKLEKLAVQKPVQKIWVARRLTEFSYLNVLLQTKTGHFIQV